MADEDFGPPTLVDRRATGVYSGLSLSSTADEWIARSPEIDLGPALREVADRILEFAIGLAAEHVESTDYVRSLNVVRDPTSPSRRDLSVGSDDPGALPIEKGHVAHVKPGSSNVPRFVEAQHILGRAAEALPRDEL